MTQLLWSKSPATKLLWDKAPRTKMLWGQPLLTHTLAFIAPEPGTVFPIGGTLGTLTLSTLTLQEGVAPGVLVATVNGKTNWSVLTLVNSAGGRFVLSGSNLLAGLVSTDFEANTTHSITIRETLIGGTNSPRDTVFNLSVTNVFEAPALIALTGSFTLPENAASGNIAGPLVGKTAGSTLSLVNDAGGRIALSGTNVVRGATALNYETATSHSFTVRETLADSPNSPRDTTFTLAVTYVDELAPTITSANPSGTFAENLSRSGTLTASETVTWTKSGADADLITLNPTTGQWSITATPNFEAKPTYSWTFTATDAAGNFSNQVVSIAITNVFEASALSALTLPATIEVGSTISIAGATPGSVITGTLPNGWVLDSSARTITANLVASAQGWVLVETLGDSPNSPRTSTGNTNVVPVTDVLLTLLPDGDVIVEGVKPAWDIVVERLATGEVQVTGGSGPARFRYSTDDSATWTEAIAPAILNEYGPVTVQAIGMQSAAGGINGFNIDVTSDGDAIIHKVSPPWTLVATRNIDGNIDVTGGTGLSRFRYSSDAGATWLEDISPTTIVAAGNVTFEPIGLEARVGATRASSVLAAVFPGPTLAVTNNVIQPSIATVLNRFGFIASPGARTNKCINNNVNPTNTSGINLGNSGGTVSITVVDDTAELIAAGLFGICNTGKVYRFDFAGTAWAVAQIYGSTGNTNVHTMSCYVRGSTGSLGYAGGADLIRFTASSGYRRVISPPSAAPFSTPMQVAGAGTGTIYFILNQLEEGFEASNILPVNGAPVTSTLPRFEYDMGEPVVGASRTNLTPWSQALDNVLWQKTNTPVTAGATLLGLPAFTVSSTANLNSHIRSVSPQPLQFSTTYTRTIFAKAVSGSGSIYFEFSTGGTLGSAWFNLLTGVATINPALGTVSMQDMGDGVWRCRHTFTTTNTGTPNHRGVYIGVYGNSPTVTTVILTGDQLEVGSEPTDYIPTYASAVTTNLTYNPAVRGLLVEPARTNLCPQSQNPADASWFGSNATKTSTNNPDPFGTSTAILLTANGSNAAAFLLTASATYVAGQTYTISGFYKAGTQKLIQLTGNGPAFGTNQYANFDLENGVVGTVVGGTAKITPAGNGWFRLAFTATATVSATSQSGAAVFISSLTDGRTPFFTPTTNLYIAGWQLEQASNASSYIPTTTAAVTRPADVLCLTNLQVPNGTYMARCWHEDHDKTDVTGVVVTNGAAKLTGVSLKPIQGITLILSTETSLQFEVPFNSQYVALVSDEF